MGSVINHLYYGSIGREETSKGKKEGKTFVDVFDEGMQENEWCQNVVK